MYCARCGKPIQPGANFCASCGAPSPRMEGPHAATPVYTPPPAQRSSTGWIVGSILALLLIVGLGYYALMQKPAAMQVAGNSPQPILRKDVSTPMMPADIRAWLDHLSKIEEKKQDLTIRQIADLKVFMTKLQALGPAIGDLDPFGNGTPLPPDKAPEDNNKSPQDVTQGKFEDLRPAWEALATEFESVPPPDECKILASDYDHALKQIPAAAGDIASMLNTIQSDPSGAIGSLSKMRSSSYNDIDRYFTQADGELTRICAKYQTMKWFNLKPDVLGFQGNF
ncbi:MAG: zinc ribbon domain-containing protein [Armatimonadetes bacterium]|nr:zinc ribbon domain-containing protein [Armatimonadota bacterium]